MSLSPEGSALLSKAKERAQVFLGERVRELAMAPAAVDQLATALEQLAGRP